MEKLPTMTATHLIKHIKALPPRERAKVNRFVYSNHVPNATTRKVLADADAGRGLVRFNKLSDLMADLRSARK